MNAVYKMLDEAAKARLCKRAHTILTQWEAAKPPPAIITAKPPSRFKSRFAAEKAAAVNPAAMEVHCVAGVFSEAQCETIVGAVRSAAAARGGWDLNRHGRYPTTDMPVAEVGPGVEQLVREGVFDGILRRYAAVYCGEHHLPEHLYFYDLFFVKYSTSEASDQRELAIHQDGSTFSFNLLLSRPEDFDGGGTFFEKAAGSGSGCLQPDGYTVHAPGRGGAVVHSGDLRHGGAAITRGERLLLVGFIGTEQQQYSAGMARWAAYDAFCKFGGAAFGGREVEALS